MLRSILSVLAGYVVMSILIMLSIPVAALAAGVPLTASPRPPALPGGYLAATLVLSLLSAAAGGWVCAWIARGARPALALAVLVLLLGAAYAVGVNDPVQPAWHVWSLPIAGAIGAAAGGAAPVLTRRAGRSASTLPR